MIDLGKQTPEESTGGRTQGDGSPVTPRPAINSSYIKLGESALGFRA